MVVDWPAISGNPARVLRTNRHGRLIGASGQFLKARVPESREAAAASALEPVRTSDPQMHSSLPWQSSAPPQPVALRFGRHGGPIFFHRPLTGSGRWSWHG